MSYVTFLETKNIYRVCKVFLIWFVKNIFTVFTLIKEARALLQQKINLWQLNEKFKNRTYHSKKFDTYEKSRKGG